MLVDEKSSEYVERMMRALPALSVSRGFEFR